MSLTYNTNNKKVKNSFSYESIFRIIYKKDNKLVKWSSINRENSQCQERRS